MTVINPLSSLRHWSHKHRPQSDAEADELRAWNFTPLAEFEVALLLRDNAPELWRWVTLEDDAIRRALRRFGTWRPSWASRRGRRWGISIVGCR